MRPNPPVPGHELLAEGHPIPLYDRETDGYKPIPGGGCRCGAKPDGWPDVSINATKRWHRQHKEQVRS